jgi:hypothetical protein
MTDTGPGISPTLVQSIVAAIADAHAGNVETTHGSLHGLLNVVLEEHEADLVKLVAPLVHDHVAEMDLPQPVKDLFHVLTHPEHQTQFFTALFAVRAIIDQFVFAAIAPLVQDVTNKAWPALGASVPLSPAAAATAVLKGVLTESQGAQWAEQSGTGAAAFHNLVQIAGNAIGIEEALLLWRRGQITEAELDRIIHYSNIRSDFGPDVKKLRYAAPSIGNVLAGAVQNQLPIPDAQTKFQEAGLAPDNFDWMYRTHGRPISPLEAARLVHRGKMTRADFDQVVRESDVKDKYIDDLFEVSVYVPPVRSVMAMLRAGAISDAQATALFLENGVRQSDIAGYLAEAHHQKSSVVRELTQAQVLRLYGAKFMDRATALTKLEALNYDATTAATLLDFADETRHERYVNAVVTRVHARYVAYKLNDHDVNVALAADGVPPDAVADLLALWKIERGANLHVLSIAQIVGAYVRVYIDAAECKRRLLAAGVQPADIGIVVADGFPPSKKVNRADIDAVINA